MFRGTSASKEKLACKEASANTVEIKSVSRWAKVTTVDGLILVDQLTEGTVVELEHNKAKVQATVSSIQDNKSNSGYCDIVFTVA